MKSHAMCDLKRLFKQVTNPMRSNMLPFSLDISMLDMSSYYLLVCNKRRSHIYCVHKYTLNCSMKLKKLPRF